MKTGAALLLTVAVLAGVNMVHADERVENVFRLHCSGCHGMEGAGSKVGRIPPFVGIVGHFAATPEGRFYLVRVPGVANAALSDSATAQLLNYVLRSWGRPEMPADTPDFTAEEVRGFREVHVDDIAKLRRKLAADLAQHGLSADY